MARNKIQDLRDHLYEMLEKLNDDDADQLTVAKAKAMADVAQTIINSAKLEIDFIRYCEQLSLKSTLSGFIQKEEIVN